MRRVLALLCVLCGLTAGALAAPQGLVLNDLTLVAVRPVAQWLGADVQYNADTHTVALQRAGQRLVMTINRRAATLNDQPLAMPMQLPALVYDATTYVPLRTLMEVFNISTSWTETTHTLTRQDAEPFTITVERFPRPDHGDYRTLAGLTLGNHLAIAVTVWGDPTAERASDTVPGARDYDFAIGTGITLTVTARETTITKLHAYRIADVSQATMPEFAKLRPDYVHELDLKTVDQQHIAYQADAWFQPENIDEESNNVYPMTLIRHYVVVDERHSFETGVTLQPRTPQTPVLPAIPDVLVFGNTSMVPLEGILPLLGATVEWTGSGNISIARGAHSFIYFPQTQTLYRDLDRQGRTIPLMPVVGSTYHNTNYFSLRVLVEGLSGTLAVEQPSRRISITLPDPPITLHLPMKPQTVAPARNRQDRAELYLMNLDGSYLTRLTYDTEEDHLPALSPDGNTLVYNHGGLLIARRLTDPQGVCLLAPPEPGPLMDIWQVSFAPDGRDLLFERNGRICLLRPDGSDLRDLAAGHAPVFLPDGQCIIFHTDEGKLMRMARDGSGLRVLTDGYYANCSPSGDVLDFRNGERYHGTPDSSKLRTCTLSATGDVGTPVTPLPRATAHEERFSPDRAHLAYVERGTAPGIYLANADGSDARRLTTGTGDSDFRFTPDGARILFRRGHDLFSVTTDGSTLTCLTYQLDCAIMGEYTLTPDGKRLVFVATPDKPLPEHDLGL